MLTSIDTLLQKTGHADYFLVFIGCFLFSYFILNPIVYFYIYKLRRSKFIHLKIQPETPTRADIINDIKWSSLTILIWSVFVYVLLFLMSKGYSRVYFDITEHSIFYFAGTVILFTIVMDTYFYWTHRFMHSHDFIYKHTHATHHITTNPTPFSIFSFSPFEAAILGFYFVIICFIIPIHIYAVVIVFMIDVVANIIGHLGYEFFNLKFSKKLDAVFIGSIHHNVHHKYGYSNYGLYFPFWDKLMNTFHHQYQKERDSFYQSKK